MCLNWGFFFSLDSMWVECVSPFLCFSGFDFPWGDTLHKHVSWTNIVVSWVWRGTWLYRFLIVASFLTFITTAECSVGFSIRLRFEWLLVRASWSKTLYPLLSTCSTLENPSQPDWKIVGWEVKNRTKTATPRANLTSMFNSSEPHPSGFGCLSSKAVVLLLFVLDLIFILYFVSFLVLQSSRWEWESSDSAWLFFFFLLYLLSWCYVAVIVLCLLLTVSWVGQCVMLWLRTRKIQKVSKYDQEIPQSHTADQPAAPRGIATEHL